MKNIKQTIKRVLRDESDVRAATAPYQADFPYDRDEEAQVTRRKFCNFLGLTSAALFLGAGGFAAKAALDCCCNRAEALRKGIDWEYLPYPS